MFGRNKDNGSQVVSMTERERAQRLKPLRQLETYWRTLAGEACGVPFRDAVDPRGIQDALEIAFLAERIAPGIVRLRVAGSHLADLMGMEVTGLPLSSFLMPDVRDEARDAVERVFRDGVALHAEMEACRGLGRGALSAHLLLLPLRSEGGRLDRALGGIVTHGQIGRVPRRFDSFAARHSDLELPAAPVAPVTPPLFPKSPALTGFAEAQSPFGPDPEAPRQSPAPYLRLVVSND
ncbi:hypothetical protein ATO8_00590 [Roseivivax marinus]|uniref:PAS domain-containing protein n=1 Tax=Roseivivax marinus TaxID=1379903 RepID=W4HQI2_9RHOB|nr:PAS domain-containing protein [Roseivivax marinus]ETW14361.1 hypothetical protein ATO8_00590 [Roseivivax marinus]